MSSPGAGKTSLLEHTLERMRGKLRLGVLEGDVQTTLDADRLARFHIPLVQVNTDPGFGGECHLDANMVRSGLSELPLDEMDVLVIRSEEHTSELQSRQYLVCRLLLEKKKKSMYTYHNHI